MVIGGSSAGDFAADWLSDKERTKSVTSRKELVTYLLCKGACPEALAAAKRVFAEYNKTRLALNGERKGATSLRM